MLTSIFLTKIKNGMQITHEGYFSDEPQAGKEATLFIILSGEVFQLETTTIRRLFNITGTNICYFETLSGSRYRLEKKEN